jgi:Flp pilus assembly protein TadB
VFYKWANCEVRSRISAQLSVAGQTDTMKYHNFFYFMVLFLVVFYSDFLLHSQLAVAVVGVVTAVVVHAVQLQHYQ